MRTLKALKMCSQILGKSYQGFDGKSTRRFTVATKLGQIFNTLQSFIIEAIGHSWRSISTIFFFARKSRYLVPYLTLSGTLVFSLGFGWFFAFCPSLFTDMFQIKVFSVRRYFFLGSYQGHWILLDFFYMWNVEFLVWLWLSFHLLSYYKSFVSMFLCLTWTNPLWRAY